MPDKTKPLIFCCNGSKAQLIILNRQKKSIHGELLFSKKNESAHQKVSELIANDPQGSVKHGSRKNVAQGSLPTHSNEKERLIDQFISDSCKKAIECYQKIEPKAHFILCTGIQHSHLVHQLLETHHLKEQAHVINKDFMQLSYKELNDWLCLHGYLDDQKDQAA